MPLNDPFITAECDVCRIESEPMSLCALAGGGWDERYIKSRLEGQQWKVDGDKTICEECAESQAPQ